MKLYFNKTILKPFSELILYSSLNPIPVILRLSNNTVLPETIYTRNLAQENFIELRFNKETKKLYEITIVAIQESTVELTTYDWECENNYYECYIKGDSELETSKPFQILRSEKSLTLSWGEQSSERYSIAKNCILGVDINDNLCSIILLNLTNEMIYEILGF